MSDELIQMIADLCDRAYPAPMYDNASMRLLVAAMICEEIRRQVAASLSTQTYGSTPTTRIAWPA